MKGIVKWGRENKNLPDEDYSDRCNHNEKDDSNPCWCCTMNNWVFGCKFRNEVDKNGKT